MDKMRKQDEEVEKRFEQEMNKDDDDDVQKKKDEETDGEEIDDVDVCIYLNYNYQTPTDKMLAKLYTIKCKLFNRKQFRYKYYEMYQTIHNYQLDMEGRSQNLPILYNRAEEYIEKELEYFEYMTVWELKEHFINEELKEKINYKRIPFLQDDKQMKFDIEQMKSLYKLNYEDLPATIQTDSPYYHDDQPDYYRDLFTEAFRKYSNIVSLGKHRHQAEFKYLKPCTKMFDKFALRHDSICEKREWDEIIGEERLFSRPPYFTKSQKEYFYPYELSWFWDWDDWKKEFNYNLQKKITPIYNLFGLRMKPGQSKKWVILDLGIFEQSVAQEESLKRQVKEVKQTYDESVKTSFKSVISNINFLKENTSKDDNIQKSIEIIRKFDPEFTVNDIDTSIISVFTRAYEAHLGNDFIVIDKTCTGEASGYFKSVQNVWAQQKIKPKYTKIWDITKSNIEKCEISQMGQPTFYVTIHCQNHHCYVDQQKKNIIKEGSLDGVMRNGYKVIAMFDANATEPEYYWKLISIQPIEKTLLLA
ncbi:hypothetical protein IMG5_161070 [Ichthyophthirius multifiliis]|uniref:Tim44-like domain-containing protein n=1 Tax=Ichthyophthirius multifiliis TaxID=5932 RepID=G0R008_ICHMU|nr:hypothetical protein IMG5_161070 [Ichthyophthirius multifiliis]EGR29191.1 hypothetical protein IMG5_161070 [Ichthyophthirius multifiliis]|eukprot:XP_004030427.1 hypothetical protein IMG5_161070 [Ichthyophthirius multifiliis]